MKIKGHSLAALPFALVSYGVSGSLTVGLAGAACSVFIDLDHIPEYLFFHNFRFRIRDFVGPRRGHVTPKVIYPLHSWDLLLPLCLFLLFWGPPGWVWALPAAWAYHLIWDQIANPVGPGFYFLTYRARHGFRRKQMRGWYGIRCWYTPIKRGKGWLDQVKQVRKPQ